HAVAVSTGVAGRRVGDQLSILVVPERARLFVASPPAADADHLVERLPAGEGVVGGVDDDQAAALPDVLLEGSFDLLRPAVVRRIVIQYDGRVLLEIGLEAADAAIRRRRGHHVHLEEAGLLELLLQHRSGQLPFVIRAAALSIEEHDAGRRGRVQGQGAEDGAKADSNRKFLHGGGSCHRVHLSPGSGLFTAFDVESHHAGIDGLRGDHLEYHPAVGRSFEQPVVGDRQGSRRGEVEGEGGGGGFVAAHPGVFDGAGGIGGDASGEMHARGIAVAGNGRRMIQNGLDSQGGEEEGEHGVYTLSTLSNSRNSRICGWLLFSRPATGPKSGTPPSARNTTRSATLYIRSRSWVTTTLVSLSCF